MTRNTVRVSGVVAAALAVLGCATAAWAGAGETLGLVRSAPAPQGLAAPGREVLRSRAVAIDLGLLPTAEDLAARGEATVGLRLFDDVVAPVRFTKAAPGVPEAPAGARVLLGEIEGRPGSLVWLSISGDALVGDITAPGYGEFQIRVAGPGVSLVREIDSLLLNPCGSGQEHNISLPGAPWPNPEPAAVGGEGERTGVAGTGPVIDVLVAWTPAARTSAGGVNGIQATIAGWAASTNQYYANSLVKQSIRIVRTQETAFTETASAGTDLDLLRGTTDGFMDELHTARDQWGADLVHLVSNSLGVCGIAYLQTTVSTGFASYGFGLTVLSCGASTFAHELGHNMGCAHDHDNASAGAYCYSFGWRSADSLWRTIMSYAPGNRIGYFSNPNITLNLNGPYTIGIDGAACPSNAADNARTLNNTASTVASFRATVVANEPPAAFSLIGPPSGSPGVTLIPELTWNPSLNAGSYEVTVSRSAALTSPVISATFPATSTSYAVPAGALQSGTSYWWRVRAINSIGATVASGAPWSFSTRFVGDINGDGTVNFTDLNIVLAQFGQTGIAIAADVNGDGVVDFADLNLVLSEFGRTT